MSKNFTSGRTSREYLRQQIHVLAVWQHQLVATFGGPKHRESRVRVLFVGLDQGKGVDESGHRSWNTKDNQDVFRGSHAAILHALDTNTAIREGGKMKVNIQIRADILKALMLEDRQEVRTIRSMIYNVVSALAISSFALSSYLLKPSPSPASTRMATDILIVVFIWAVFGQLKRDLYHSRQGLVVRQELIKRLDEGDKRDFDPFADARTVIPDITDADLWWIPIAATAMSLLKALALLIWRV